MKKRAGTSKFKIGTRVKVARGIVIEDPVSRKLPLGGWEGTVIGAEPQRGRMMCQVEWSDETLARMPRSLIKSCSRKNIRYRVIWLNEKAFEPIEERPPRSKRRAAPHADNGGGTGTEFPDDEFSGLPPDPASIYARYPGARGARIATQCAQILILMDEGHFPAAAKAARSLLVMAPDFVWADFVLGAHYMGNLEYHKAVPHLLKCCARYPASLFYLMAAFTEIGALPEAAWAARQFIDRTNKYRGSKGLRENIVALRKDACEFFNVYSIEPPDYTIKDLRILWRTSPGGGGRKTRAGEYAGNQLDLFEERISRPGKRVSQIADKPRIRIIPPKMPVKHEQKAPAKPAPENPVPPPAGSPAPPPALALPELRLEFHHDDASAPDNIEHGALAPYRLRLEYRRLVLLRGFDELICLPTLRGVEKFWYQVETAKKVLRHFRGRVLLADEVGLGKTIEAGMLIKEYILRGMVKSALILTPPSLVSQWREEMDVKFGLDFTPAERPELAKPGFWQNHPLIVASINVAKSDDHFDTVCGRNFDLVVVDEAHHLKNRATKNWKLVNAIQKRFIFLLTATPVQNDLMELYNLLALLKPGHLDTEDRFRKHFIKRSNPRAPANADELRDLLRDVMIHNTRSLSDAKLPPRHASTVMLEPPAPEAAFYKELSDFVRRETREGRLSRMTGHALLTQAGSGPEAAREGLWRLHQRANRAETAALLEALEPVRGVKMGRLVELLKSKEDKKLVFVRHVKTLDALSERLRNEGVSHRVFKGGMSAAEKDAAINAFRDETDTLLSTETGGEGRNIQFCRSMINYDLP